jgi:hypothetical protein
VTFYLLAVLFLGALCSAPAWIEYGRRRGYQDALTDVERRWRRMNQP